MSGTVYRVSVRWACSIHTPDPLSVTPFHASRFTFSRISFRPRYGVVGFASDVTCHSCRYRMEKQNT
jgi:hypothetical protein